MSTQIVPQPGILSIDPYTPGESSLQGVERVIKLSSNENPAGPSPRAVEAAREALSGLNRYPDSGHGALRAAIGAAHGLPPEQLICGAGSDELISLLCQAYAGPGTEVVHSAHGFLMYRISALAAGAVPVAAPERERVTDIDALLAACGPATRLVFVANPNNPTGTMVDAAAIARLADGLPADALLVLDGAYAEYVEGFDGGAALVGSRRNVVMTRTFSKLYGLGGLRIGWAYAPAPVIDVLNRIRGPFNLSSPQIAAATAAVADTAHARAARLQNARWRDWLAAALAEAGVPSDRSYANFVLARFESREEAEACEAALRGQGVLVRKVDSYGLPDCLRISVGDETACRRVAEIVAGFKAGRV